MTVKLIIRDETNCKFEGLDVEHRRILSNKFKVEVPGVRFTPAVRLGRWDGKVSFFQLSGSTYINLLPVVLPELEKWKYQIEVEDLRDYAIQFTFEPIIEDTFAHKTWPKGHRFAGDAIKLRDYQIEHINMFLANTQCLQEIATGAGKTLITSALSQCIEPYGRSVVIVPNKSLVTQTEDDYKNLGLDVGVYYGDRKEYNKTHTICTWQSLGILLKNTKAGEADVTIVEFLEGVICVIVDECFDGETSVLTPDGYVAIKDIEPGNIIINYSESSREFKEDIVLKQHINLNNSNSEKMYMLEFDNGTRIEVTGNHKFLTTSGWVRADELSDNHEIINKT